MSLLSRNPGVSPLFPWPNLGFLGAPCVMPSTGSRVGGLRWALWDIFRFPRSPAPVSLQEIDNVWISSKLSRELPYVPPAPQLLFWGLAVPAVWKILRGVPQKPPQNSRARRLTSVLPLLLCRRYFELCFGEVRIRTDLQKGPGFQPHFPGAPSEADGGDVALKPSLLRLLSQVGSAPSRVLQDVLLWGQPSP